MPQLWRGDHGLHPSARPLEQQRLADLEAAREKRLRWKAPMAQTKIDYAEEVRVQRLEAQKEAWRRAAGPAEYIDALRPRTKNLPTGTERDGAEAWIACASGHVQRLNPLNGTLHLPDIPEPHADDLQPFLHGWNPYGPASKSETPRHCHGACSARSARIWFKHGPTRLPNAKKGTSLDKITSCRGRHPYITDRAPGLSDRVRQACVTRVESASRHRPQCT